MPLLLLILLGGGLWYLARQVPGGMVLPTGGDLYLKPGDTVLALVRRPGAEGLPGASTALSEEIQSAFARYGYQVAVTGAMPTGGRDSVYKVVQVQSAAANVGVPSEPAPIASGITVVKPRAQA